MDKISAETQRGRARKTRDMDRENVTKKEVKKEMDAILGIIVFVAGMEVGVVIACLMQVGKKK